MTRIVTILIAFCLIGSTAWAEDKPLTEKPLSDDTSRSQLFEVMFAYLKAAAHEKDRTYYAFPRLFSFPDDTIWRDSDTKKERRQNQIFGIDLSHHNSDACGKPPCPIDWNALSAVDNVKYAYLKVSQGVGSYDAFFETYRNAARSLPASKKIYVGPYHFLSSSESGEQQAAYFLRRIGKLPTSKPADNKLAPDDLPPTLDLEWDIRTKNGKIIMKGKDPYDFWEEVSKDNPRNRPDEILRRTVAWLDAVARATGRTPMVYTNTVWWDQMIRDEKKISALSKYLIWISDYSKSGLANEKTAAPNNRTWTIWQFSDLGRTPSGGIMRKHSVDANVFNGTMEDFVKDMGISR